jgi:hypothetical protein
VHLIQIIGEAAAGVSDDLTTTHPEVPWRQIIATRNRVVHGYFEVDLDILWDVAVRDVPGLVDQVQRILTDITPDGETDHSSSTPLDVDELLVASPRRSTRGYRQTDEYPTTRSYSEPASR